MKVMIALVDPDYASRARLTAQLSALWHVEPFEDDRELEIYFPKNIAFLLVHDQGNVLDRVLAKPEAIAELIVAFSDAPTAERIVQTVQSGVADYLSLPLDLERMAQRLERSFDRIASDVRVRRRRAVASRRADTLSPREVEVAREFVRGNSNKEIAKTLGISPRTVEIHRGNMLSKLEAGTSAEAVRILLEAGVVN